MSEAAFYAWSGGKSCRMSRRRSEQAEAVKDIFYLHRRHYGARRVSTELKASGLAVGRRLAASLMKAQNILGFRLLAVPENLDKKPALDNFILRSEERMKRY